MADLPQEQKTHFLFHWMANGFDVELGVLIRKSCLERDGWEAGVRAFESQGDWDQFPDYVASGTIPQGIPIETYALLATEGFDAGPQCRQLELEGRDRQVSCLPLIDAGGRDIGRLVVSLDTTDRRDALVRIVLLVALACLAGGVLVVFVSRFYAGRLSRRLRDAT